MHHHVDHSPIPQTHQLLPGPPRQAEANPFVCRRKGAQPVQLGHISSISLYTQLFCEMPVKRGWPSATSVVEATTKLQESHLTLQIEVL